MTARTRQAEHALRDVPDKELAQRARAGSVGAFGELVRRFEDRLFNFIRQRTGNEHDAEDITQEAFLRAWRNIERYDERWQFSTWLYTIAVRHTIDVQNRRRPVLNAHVAERVPAPNRDPAARLVHADERSNLWDLALTALNEQERSVLWLRYAEELDTKSISRVLGKTAINVRVTLHRSLRKLQKAATARPPEKTGQVRLPGATLALSTEQGGHHE